MYSETVSATASTPEAFWRTKGRVEGLMRAIERMEGIESDILNPRQESEEAE